jgi:hypothetical protein
LGWKSRGYGIKEPITTLRARYQGKLPHVFMTRIQTGNGPSKISDSEWSLIKGWMDESRANRAARCSGGLH